MGEQISQELIDRAIALVRKAAKVRDGVTIIGWEILDEARNIVDQLPAPIDPDLLLARKLACENSRWVPGSDAWLAVEEGISDHIPMVKVALAAIKLIRSENNHG